MSSVIASGVQPRLSGQAAQPRRHVWTPVSRFELHPFHERHDDEDDREDHQNVDRRAQNMEADPTDQPKDKQNDRNSPKHTNLSPVIAASVVLKSGPLCEFGDSHWKSGIFGKRMLP